MKLLIEMKNVKKPKGNSRKIKKKETQFNNGRKQIKNVFVLKISNGNEIKRKNSKKSYII